MGVMEMRRGLLMNMRGGTVVDTLDQLLKNTLTSFSSDFTGDIADKLFKDKTALISVSFNELSGTIKNAAFSGCTNLANVSFPKATVIGGGDGTPGYVFYNCGEIKTLSLKSVTTINGAYNFQTGGNQLNPSIIVLPSVIGDLGSGDTFRNGRDRYFDAIDIGPGATKLPNRCFYQSHYKDIILRSSSAVVANNVNSLDGLESTTTVYVPNNLISTYESESNWSTAKASKGFAFSSIEGSKYENYYADGTAII